MGLTPEQIKDNAREIYQESRSQGVDLDPAEVLKHTAMGRQVLTAGASAGTGATNNPASTLSPEVTRLLEATEMGRRALAALAAANKPGNRQP